MALPILSLFVHDRNVCFPFSSSLKNEFICKSKQARSGCWQPTSVPVTDCSQPFRSSPSNQSSSSDPGPGSSGPWRPQVGYDGYHSFSPSVGSWGDMSPGNTQKRLLCTRPLGTERLRFHCAYCFRFSLCVCIYFTKTTSRFSF